MLILSVRCGWMMNSKAYEQDRIVYAHYNRLGLHLAYIKMDALIDVALNSYRDDDNMFV